jgi:hypothetical protein
MIGGVCSRTKLLTSWPENKREEEEMAGVAQYPLEAHP